MNEPAINAGTDQLVPDKDLLCWEDNSLLPSSPAASGFDFVDRTAQLKLLTPYRSCTQRALSNSPFNLACVTPKDKRHAYHGNKDKDRKETASTGVQDRDLNGVYHPYLYGGYLYDHYTWKYALQSRPPYHPIDYASVQLKVSPHKRSAYIQWLIKSVEQFKFDFETFLLAVNLFDRFMAITELKYDYDQKMAIAAAFLVAAKKEEVHYPGVDEVVRLCGRSYENRQIRQMEEALLRKLSWHLCAPTASHFIEYYMSLMREIDIRSYRQKVHQLLTTSSAKYDLCHYLPSTLAATAICLAHDLLSQPPVMAGQSLKIFMEPDALHFLIHLPSEELVNIYYCYDLMRHLSGPQPTKFYFAGFWDQAVMYGTWSTVNIQVLLVGRQHASTVFHGLPAQLLTLASHLPAIK